MGGIYIPDVSLPGDGDFELWIAVKRDGSFNYNVMGAWRSGNHKVIPVPPHGRLIDADELEKSFREDADAEWNRFAAPVNWADAFDDVANIVADAPTIIPAELAKDGE